MQILHLQLKLIKNYVMIKLSISIGGVFSMKIKKLVSKLMSVGVLNSLALVLVAQNVNQACMWFFHQPEAPESADCFKRH